MCNSNGKTDKRALKRLSLDSAARDSTSDVSISQQPLNMTASEQPVNAESPTKLSPVHLRDSRPSDTCIAATSPKTMTRRDLSASFSPGIASNVTQSEISSSDEKGFAWAGYEVDILPEKTQGKYVRNLRHQVFTLYRRLFGVVFIANMAVFITILCRGTNALKVGEIAIANLLCAILMRQDYVINLFFNVFCSVPSSCVVPLLPEF